MTTTEGEITVPLPEISHIGFVVEDLETGMDEFSRLFGISPWMLYRYEPPRFTDTTYRGEPEEYSMRVALSDVKGPIDKKSRGLSGETLGRIIGRITSIRDRLVGAGADDKVFSQLPAPGIPGVNVELIEPLEGESTYTEFLAEDGRGIHHIGCFAYDNPREVVEMYENAGFPVVQSGQFEGLEFWYLDFSAAIDGVILEIAANLWAVPEPDSIYTN